jgi:hypothetical protein
MFGVIDIKSFTFKDIPEVIFVLKIAYSDTIPKATIKQEILKLY